MRGFDGHCASRLRVASVPKRLCFLRSDCTFKTLTLLCFALRPFSAFKKYPDEKKLEHWGPLLKSYQSEIDNLTKRRFVTGPPLCMRVEICFAADLLMLIAST